MASHASAYAKLDREVAAAQAGTWTLRLSLGYALTVLALAALFLGRGFGPALGDLFFGVPTIQAGWAAVAAIAVPVAPLATFGVLVVGARLTAEN